MLSKYMRGKTRDGKPENPRGVHANLGQPLFEDIFSRTCNGGAFPIINSKGTPAQTRFIGCILQERHSEELL